MLRTFLQNHVLANLTFVMVLVIGFYSYTLLPRQQDPMINFNWINIMTVLPGASSSDVEKRVTTPLEEAIRKVQDIDFVSSDSRESISNILVRFNDIDERTFDKRVADLRREIQNKERELPLEVESPYVFEVTSANGFPSAMVLVTGLADDENLRIQARNIQKDIEQIKDVDQVTSVGLNDPELQIKFIPERLYGLGISPTDIADAINMNFRDTSAGNISVDDTVWSIRTEGTTNNPNDLAKLLIGTKDGEIPLSSLAEVERGREKADALVSYQGKPGILFSITKTGNSNTLQLVERITQYVDERNRYTNETGINVILVDDQTEVTRNALSVMQTNALIGLLMVLLVTWAFLGFKIAILTSIGIPFILTGTFWVLYSVDQTLNVIVLLGIVISLGMLVDDAVVVVESIYYRLQRGGDALNASIDALKEVFAPVTTAVLTTMAAFLPLMLMPGILGKFMFVLPFVVTTSLAISLVEAYWMLPAHIMASKISFDRPSASEKKREYYLHQIRLRYTRLLTKALRYQGRIIGGICIAFMISISAIPLGLIKTNFFAADPLKLFYVNIEMPPGTTLEQTLRKTEQLEVKVRKHLYPEEIRSVVSYSGQMFTETAPFFGDNYGQIIVSLNGQYEELRDVRDIIDGMRADVGTDLETKNISFLRMDGGPPKSLPISIKVLGDTFDEIRTATKVLHDIMKNTQGVKDIVIDEGPGQQELILNLDMDAVLDAGLTPTEVSRTIRLLVDGEMIATMQDQGEELTVRVIAKHNPLQAVSEILRFTLPLANGDEIPLSELVTQTKRTGLSAIRHYNFRRTIEIKADIDNEITDTVSANQAILTAWDQVAIQHPNIKLDTSGLLDDINESLASLQQLFLFGVLLIYSILGTQFRSYFQPLMILATIPMALTGVLLGLVINQNNLSLYTLYGVVALGGIAVNAAIVMISTANNNIKKGMSVLHATIYAARRRVVPIIITSLTTIAGLFSLAVGLGGYSLMWGPVATSIVWGLGFSTLLTLFMIPLLYNWFMDQHYKPYLLRIKTFIRNMIQRIYPNALT